MLIDDVKGALAALKAEMQEDSRLDCAQLFPMKARKSVAVKAERVGHLTADDEAKVLPHVDLLTHT